MRFDVITLFPEMLSVLSHIEVTSYAGPLDDWQRVAQQARQNPAVIAAAPFINAQAMFVRDESVRGALIRGVDPAAEPGVSDIARLAVGQITDLVDGEFNVVLGGELARAMAVSLGDRVTLIAPQGNVTPAAWCRGCGSSAWWASSSRVTSSTTARWR